MSMLCTLRAIFAATLIAAASATAPAAMAQAPAPAPAPATQAAPAPAATAVAAAPKVVVEKETLDNPYGLEARVEAR